MGFSVQVSGTAVPVSDPAASGKTRNLKLIKQAANLLAAKLKYYSGIDLLSLLLDNRVIQSYQLKKMRKFSYDGFNAKLAGRNLGKD